MERHDKIQRAWEGQFCGWTLSKDAIKRRITSYNKQAGTALLDHVQVSLSRSYHAHIHTQLAVVAIMMLSSHSRCIPCTGVTGQPSTGEAGPTTTDIAIEGDVLQAATQGGYVLCVVPCKHHLWRATARPQSTQRIKHTLQALCCNSVAKH